MLGAAAGVATGAAATTGGAAEGAAASVLALPPLSARMPTTASSTTAAPSTMNTTLLALFGRGYESRSSSALDWVATGIAIGAARTCEGTVRAIGFRAGGGACASGAITTAGVLGPSFGV